jgi:hypothetical protein
VSGGRARYTRTPFTTYCQHRRHFLSPSSPTLHTPAPTCSTSRRSGLASFSDSLPGNSSSSSYCPAADEPLERRRLYLLLAGGLPAGEGLERRPGLPAPPPPLLPPGPGGLPPWLCAAGGLLGLVGTHCSALLLLARSVGLPGACCCLALAGSWSGAVARRPAALPADGPPPLGVAVLRAGAAGGCERPPAPAWQRSGAQGAGLARPQSSGGALACAAGWRRRPRPSPPRPRPPASPGSAAAARGRPAAARAWPRPRWRPRTGG